MKNPCPAPTLLDVSFVFEYLEFPPVITDIEDTAKLKFKIKAQVIFTTDIFINSSNSHFS